MTPTEKRSRKPIIKKQEKNEIQLNIKGGPSGLWFFRIRNKNLLQDQR